MKNLILILVISLSSTLLVGQNFGIGASAMYNFQSEGLGIGVRGNFYPNDKLSFVPQISYYHIILGTVNEFTLGLGIEYKLFYIRNITFYALGHAGYNHWLNPEISPMENPKTVNWNLEGGAGITTNWCLRPFLEYRYNIKFQETHLQLGLLYIFGCSGGGGNGNGYNYRDPKRMRRGTICPAY